MFGLDLGPLWSQYEAMYEFEIDLLVEFEPGRTLGLLGIAGMELSRMFGRKVDLRTPEDLSRYSRQSVLDEAQVQYAQE